MCSCEDKQCEPRAARKLSRKHAREADVAQARERDVLDVDPLDLEHTLPLVGRPHVRGHGVVDRREHLRHARKVAAAVDGEEEVDRALVGALAEGAVEALVAEVGRRPDLVLERLVHVLLRVALDDEEAGLFSKKG